ncbi:TetR/AcrR family transcriptional regulator [Ruminiclostridium cellobioparum]|jgi:AcrR family transcriptional regulator|uniref:TetR/AcrR family transcriptional regulator n=1 Tax=Ruminiclostridium cellobioparum TaxID=29355 RepID=UPI0004836EA5|nr:TetR/AcrR family transcriptional regulator [Ruminiclostridium cellobioparum]
MPKVHKEYAANKRNFIIKCANEAFMEKPLYQITMRDIIVKTGFSQGTIYRYYSNVDEIFLDSVNRSTPPDVLESAIGHLFSLDKKEADIVFESINAMGYYIKKLQNTVGGKILFGILVLYAFDQQKKESVLQRLIFRQSLDNAQSLIIGYIRQNIEKGVFKPIIPLEEIIRFTQAAVDGISTDTAIQSIAGRSETYISEMFATLAKAILYFLGTAEE